MNIALKEWASVVGALGSGLQVCLLRKGGIVEADRGGFHLRHRRFLLLPTYEHEQTKMLQDRHAALLMEPDHEWHDISLVCEVADVFTTHGIDQLRAGADHFVWNDAFLRKRVDYRPDLPLYCIVLRAYHLPERIRIPDRRSYAGCKSWVHLTEEINVDGATPVLNDREFAQRRDALVDALTGAAA